jgi:DNA-directed RNA polymerase subunit alpha
VTAGDIQLNQNLELVNPKQHICTLDKKKKFEMELTVKVGRGFAPATKTKSPARPSASSPLIRFSRRHPRALRVENARVGQRTDYDR